ncbi:DUF2764 family protein [Desulfobacter curvatus]|uniref:DUF2764 family protein n=1 Tax=Desulfobacter curvatus TaxID=2290 RepID=UPI000363B1E4|nr:DUF2764 family protein [Desulfobacter curvatus]
MRRAYYYTLASLPSLFFASPLPLTIKDFFSQCRFELTSKDFAILQSAQLSPSDYAPLPFLKKWYSRERQIRNELVRLRARKLGWDAGRYRRKGEEDGERAVKFARDIFSMDSPGTAEKRLDQERWNYLSEMESNHYFDLEKLISYALKLKINEKILGLDPQKGWEKQEAILARLPDHINL